MKFKSKKQVYCDPRPVSQVVVVDHRWGKVDRIFCGIFTFGLSELIIRQDRQFAEIFLDKKYPEYRHKVRMVYPKKFVGIPNNDPAARYLMKCKVESIIPSPFTPPLDKEVSSTTFEEDFFNTYSDTDSVDEDIIKA